MKSSFDDPRTGTGVEGAAANLINGKIYVSHGFRGGDSALLSIYDVASDTWTHGGTTAPDAAVIRSEMAGATALGKHYAIGGRTGPTAANEQFDPTANTWTMKASMSTARGGVGAASSNNKIYAIGGRDGGTYGSGNILNLNEVYDPSTDTWTTLAPLPTAVSDDYAMVAFNGNVYVFGGTTGGNAGLTSLVQIYNIVNNTWSSGAPMPTPRGAAMAGVIDGVIAVFGGVDVNTADLAVTEIYDPVANSWSTGPNMVVATSEMAQGVAFDGTQIFAIGMGIFGVSGMTVQALVPATPVPILTLTEAGTGSGTVTSTPAGVSCPAVCASGFASGTSVNLGATPASGSTFAGWSGAGCSGTGTCSVTMSANQSVTATFNATPTNFTLTVTEAGTGTGTVTSSPSGINCPTTCAASFASGSSVTLTATGATGSTFAGWSGNGACTGTGTCTLTMNSAQSVTATFNTTPMNFTLSVTEAGTGTGSVSSSPSGITCPDVCSASFAAGTMVTLTATASTGSTFAGWSGASCSGTLTCSVTMNANQSVTATFNVNGGVNFTLTVAPGGGTTATVHPGDTAIFPLTLTPVNGFTGTVTLTCASQQPTITCSITPNTVNLPAGGSTAISVNTFCAWLGPRFGPPGDTPGPWLPATALLGLALIASVAGMQRRRLRLVISVAMLALVAMLGAGCANLARGPAGRTPPGNYALVITASAPGSAPQTITLTLNVI